MKKLLFIFPFLILSLLIGCGGDKGTGDDNGGGDDETFQPRVVAQAQASGPSTIDATDPVWETIEPALVQIGFSTDYGQNGALYKDTLEMKVITTADMIYIWANWYDQSGDFWGQYDLKSYAVGQWQHLTTYDENAGEDAFFIIFDAGDNGDEGADCATMCHAVSNRMATTGGGHADAWSWRSARIAPAFLAEDEWWTSTGNYLDPPAALNPQKPYVENWSPTPLPGQPEWMHEDDTAFHGPYLYADEAIDFNASPFYGWDDVGGYKMPGYVIDSSIHSLASRDDRWNVLSASDYDSESTRRSWTVVLSRTLAPATTNDVDFRDLDSIQVTIAASNDHTFGADPSFREHSGSVPFYIVFPQPAK